MTACFPIFVMKTVFYFIFILLLTFSVNSEEVKGPKLILKGKAVQVLPVDLTDSKWGKASDETQKAKISEKYAVVFANLLQRSACKAKAGNQDFTIHNRHDSAEISKELKKIVLADKVKFDFTIYISISSDQELNSVRFWLLDTNGDVVLNDEESKFERGRPRNPLATFLYVLGMIGQSSDIEDPMKVPDK